MAIQQSTIGYILVQFSSLTDVSAKKMFVGYAVYRASKVVALVCDYQLFAKPIKSSKDYVGNTREAVLYKCAKQCFWISDEQLEDADCLNSLAISAKELLLPKPKKFGKSA